MNNSKPGQKLDPRLKAIIDPIYEHDKARYQRICQWVWWAQRAGWPDEAIGKAVKLAGENVHQVAEWWPYLSSLLPKASGRASEEESDRYKRQEFEFLSGLLGPGWAKRRERRKTNE